jgi:hypothetical protein
MWLKPGMNQPPEQIASVAARLSGRLNFAGSGFPLNSSPCSDFSMFDF